MSQAEVDGDFLDEDGVYVPDNIWGWDGLARALRLQRKETKENRQRSTARILEKMVSTVDLRYAAGDD